MFRVVGFIGFVELGVDVLLPPAGAAAAVTAVESLPLPLPLLDLDELLAPALAGPPPEADGSVVSWKLSGFELSMKALLALLLPILLSCSVPWWLLRARAIDDGPPPSVSMTINGLCPALGCAFACVCPLC